VAKKRRRRPVVLDMDPGVDDAVALLLALNNPELEVLAVTTVSGNVGARTAARNALRIIEAAGGGSAGKNVPVYVGASRPLRIKRAIHAFEIHGRDGLGNCGLPPSHIRSRLAAAAGKDATAAAVALSNLVREHKGDLSIVATGPLTNLATLIGMMEEEGEGEGWQLQSAAERRLPRIFVMGGIYDPAAPGNVRRHAEFNFYVDPDAADIVMRSFAAGNVVASGLDITGDPAYAVGEDMLARICSLGERSRAARAACSILKYPVQRDGIFHLHDVFALFAMLHPEMFETERCTVRIDCSRMFRGRCIATPSRAGGVLACKKVVAGPALFGERLLGGLA
jgi:inosine-uridine nucleoside N-ribohydrolase